MSNSTRLIWLVENNRALLCDCYNCGNHSEVDPKPILKRLGDQFIPDLKRWARCTRCGSKDVSTRPQFPAYAEGFSLARAYR